MNNTKMLEIADTDFFRNWLIQIYGGETSLESISRDLGHGKTYVSQALNTKRIALTTVLLLENKFGIDHEDMLAVLNASRNREQDASGTTIEEIKKLVERQTAMLSSIGQILTSIEDIMTKTWT